MKVKELLKVVDELHFILIYIKDNLVFEGVNEMMVNEVLKESVIKEVYSDGQGNMVIMI